MHAAGTADPRLAAALRAHASAATASSRAELLAALLDASVLAGVSATATGVERAPTTGLRAESGADLAVLLLEASDGSRALPVFSNQEELRRWRGDARPVPLTGAQACAAALDEGACQVVLDPAGAAVQLEPAELSALAAGWVPVPGSTLSARTANRPMSSPAAAIDPALLVALRAAISCEPVRAARLLQGPDGWVLGICPHGALGPAELAALAQRLMDRLGEDLPRDGLDLLQVPFRGPGLPLLRRRRQWK